jgi:cell division protein YceG involved in septum cleavage
MYFVARGDGTNSFSATFEEHQEAIRRYLGSQE